MEYCPECIEVLKPQSKKFGGITKWLVCPMCGYRTRAKSEYLKNKEIEEFSKYKEFTNANNLSLE